MATVKVKMLDASSFEVTVQGGHTTTHIVTVSAPYAEKLTQGRATTEQLVRRSFDFLLQRESNTSILQSFELSVIARYFPEYERVIRGMLSD